MTSIYSYDKVIENISNLTKDLMDRNKQRNFNLARITFFEILDSSYGTSPRLLNNDEELNNFNIPKSKDYDIFHSLLFLRDTILKTTGKRIWGLTFTLYPDGKHEIEYDYNVPEGFNEKGEWIGEEHNNEAVGEFFDNIRKIGTDDFELK